MAIMNLIMSATLTNWVGKLLELLYNAIGNFGWTVVVFSIILKVALSPLDIWQRVSTKNQQKKMEAIKPKLEKLEKQYRNNPDLLKQKQYEVQREAKINVFATCLPLIVTMVVFFVVFGGFRALVTYENELIVEELDKTYVSYVLDYNANKLTDEQKAEVDITNWDALKAYCEDQSHGIATGFTEYTEFATEAPEKYVELRNLLADTYEKHLEADKWLWVKNIFKSDTGTDVVPSVKAYTSGGAGLNYTYNSGNDVVYTADNSNDTYNVTISRESSVRINDNGGVTDVLNIITDNVDDLRIYAHTAGAFDWDYSNIIIVNKDDFTVDNLINFVEGNNHVGLDVSTSTSSIETYKINGTEINKTTWYDSVHVAV